MRKTIPSRVLLICLVALCTIYLAPTANAYPTGITGLSTTGCNGCHSGASMPSVTITGPTSVVSGSTNTYTLTITNTGQAGGGLDVSASGGTLAAGSDSYTQLLSGEVTHKQPKPADAVTGDVTFTFSWKAPTVTAGSTTVTLSGAGLSANLDTHSTGDRSNTTTHSINVTPPTPTNQPPTITSTGGPYSGIMGVPVTFTGSATDPDGDTLTYTWTFGDGGSATGQTVNYTYASAGTFNVTLSVSDGHNPAVSANTVANIYAGATPIVSGFRAPGHVGFRAGSTVTKTLSVTAYVNGVAPGTTVCGTAFLDKNGAAFQNQPNFCMTQGSSSTAQFNVTFDAGYAPSVTWSAYVVLQDNTKSNVMTKTTNVKVR